MSQPLQISEICASNQGNLFDHRGNSPDWIEIANTSKLPVDLSKYFISDQADQPFKYQLPSFQLSAGNRILVFASGRDTVYTAKGYSSYYEEPWQRFTSETLLTDELIAWYAENMRQWASNKSAMNQISDSGLISYHTKRLYLPNKKSLESFKIRSLEKKEIELKVNGVLVKVAANSGNTIQFADLRKYLKEGFNFLSIAAQAEHDYTEKEIAQLFYLKFKRKSDFERRAPEIHLNFKLNRKRESIAISDSVSIIHQIKWHDAPVDRSFITDDSSAALPHVFEQISPNLPNASVRAQLPDVQIHFDREGGFFSDPFEVKIIANVDTDVQIRYSTDRSEPTFESELYEWPLLIDGSTILFARAFIGENAIGETIRASYLFDQPSDLPVLSIVFNNEALFDRDTGLYKPGLRIDPHNPNLKIRYLQNFYIDKPIQAEAQWFHPNKAVEQHSQKVDLKLFGDYSRLAPQKGLQLISKEANSVIQHGLFDDLQQSSRLILRNGGDEWQFGGTRDAIVNKVSSSFFNQHWRVQPVIVYLNGRYWGRYNARNKLDREGIAEINQLSKGNVWYHDFGNPAQQNHHDEVFRCFGDPIQTDLNCIDQKNMIDYFIIQLFFDNRDHFTHNVKMWRKEQADRWRYLLFDLDQAMQNGWSAESFNRVFKEELSSSATNAHVPAFLQLLSHDQFKHEFIDRFQELLNYDLSSASTIEVLGKFVHTIENENLRSFRRWQKSAHRQSVRFNSNMYQEQIDSVIIPYLLYRPNEMFEQLAACFDLDRYKSVKIIPADSSQVKYNRHDIDENKQLNLLPGIPVMLEAKRYPGRSFVAWQVFHSGKMTLLKQALIKIDPAEFDSIRSVYSPVTFQKLAAASENLTLQKGGRFFIEDSFRVQSGVKMQIEEGATIFFAESAHLTVQGQLEVKGSADKPINMLAADDHWKGITIQNGELTARHLILSNLSKDQFAISGYNSTLNIEALNFGGTGSTTHISGGGVFAKNCHINLSNCRFSEGLTQEPILLQLCDSPRIEKCIFGKIHRDRDAIDLNGVSNALINKNYFHGGDDDGIDIGAHLSTNSSQISIDDNVIMRYLDKGISVGEQSTDITVSGSRLIKNGSGLSVKDGSQVALHNSSLIANRIALEAFEKEKDQGGGTIVSKQSVHRLSSHSDLFSDKHSRIDLAQTSDSVQQHRCITGRSPLNSTSAFSASNNEENRFALAGHIYDNNSSKGTYPPFLKALKHHSSNFAFLCGDVVKYNKLENWSKLFAELNTFQMPFYIAAGNHDESDSALFEDFCGCNYYYFRRNHDLFIILDPNHDKWNISPEQILMIKRALQENEQAERIFVFFHQVLWWNPNHSDFQPNSNEGRAENINFETDILPLFKPSSQEVFFFAGDMGAAEQGLSFKKEGNLHFVATGMGSGMQDNYIEVISKKGEPAVIKSLHFNAKGDITNQIELFQ